MNKVELKKSIFNCNDRVRILDNKSLPNAFKFSAGAEGFIHSILRVGLYHQFFIWLDDMQNRYCVLMENRKMTHLGHPETLMVSSGSITLVQK